MSTKAPGTDAENVGETDGELESTGSGSRDFVRTIIDADLASGKHQSVVTRFPPEPNGYLHIGHAKAICLSFGIAEEYGGRCHLRFDDTNPTTENPEFVASIQRDIQWLGFDWGEHKYHASGYFEQLYGFAVELIEKGLAYVDSQSLEEIRENRGTIDEAGKPSPFRERSVEENLDLFRRMRQGEFPDGSHVLRAKIDMAAANMLMRDPVLYRIRHATHYRTGDAWSVYPMYDFAHCLSDAIEHITHSLCTLEFENNREIYDWLVERVSVPARPRQYEFARLNLSYTMMSKRKLLQLVGEGHVSGWDDPRLPTLSGFRRRGVTPEAIRAFCERVGVAKTHNVIDLALLEFSIRDDLNHRAPRVLGVLRPLPLVIENYPESEESFEAPFWPRDVPQEGSRALPFTRELLVERDDFEEDPPLGFHRLAPGREVRLRYAYVVRCTGVDRDKAGNIVRVRCTYDPETRGGTTPDGRRVPGTIHWVSASHAVPAEVRLYDRLFESEAPGTGDHDFREDLNPRSLEILTEARVEPGLASARAGDRFQLERQGYFAVDPDSTHSDTADGKLVLNRTVTLRDTWAKVAGDADQARAESAATRAAEKAAHKAAQRAQAQNEASAPALEGEALTAFEGFQSDGLREQEARVLAADTALAAFYRAGTGADADASARGVANWTVNELRGLIAGRDLAALPIAGKTLARLVALVEADAITAAAAKDVLAELVEQGGDPDAIVAHRGLAKVADTSALLPWVEAAIGENPAQAAAYRDGKQALLGFFVGQVMKRSGGNADPKQVRSMLQEHLDAASD